MFVFSRFIHKRKKAISSYLLFTIYGLRFIVYCLLLRHGGNDVGKIGWTRNGSLGKLKPSAAVVLVLHFVVIVRIGVNHNDALFVAAQIDKQNAYC